MAYTGNLIPTMTSNSDPLGVARASSEYSSTYAAWKAFEKTNAAFWRSTSAGKTPSNLNYVFVLPQVIDMYTITASTTTNCAPKDWKFQGRNGSSWTDLDTQSGITFTSNQKKSYTFSNSTKYQEYRILVSANNGGTYTEIAEMEMMATISGGSKVSNIDLQTEIGGISRTRIPAVNLQVEATSNHVRIASVNLQVEWVEVIVTSRLKCYEDGEWVAHPLKAYIDGEWVEKPLKFHNGEDWTI